MTEQIRENYFLTVKTFFILFIEIYLLLIRQAQAGISGGIFLLLALFFGLFIGQAFLVFWYGKLFLLPGGVAVPHNHNYKILLIIASLVNYMHWKCCLSCRCCDIFCFYINRPDNRKNKRHAN